MENFELIQCLAQWHEQDQFNRFIDSLAINQSIENSGQLAWSFCNIWRRDISAL